MPGGRLNRSKVLLACLLGLAAFQRSLYLLELSTLPAWTHARGDEAFYLQAVAALFGHGAAGAPARAFYLSPLYTLLLAGIRSIAGPSPLAWRLVQVGLSFGSALLLGAVAARRFGTAGRLVAVFLFLFAATTIFYESNLAVATLATFTFVTVIWAVDGWAEAWGSKPDGWPARWRWLLAGVMLGWAILARPNAALLLLPLAAAPWIVPSPAKRGARARASATIVLVALACTVPVTVHNYRSSGNLVWVSDSGGINFYIGNHYGASGAFSPPRRVPGSGNVFHQRAAFTRAASAALGPSPSWAAVNRYWLEETLREIVHHPGAWLRLMGRKVWLVFDGQEVSNNRNLEFRELLMANLGPWFVGVGWLTPFAILGFLVWLRRWRSNFLLLGLTATYVVAIVLFFVLGRFRYVLVPVFILAAMQGCVTLWQLARARRWRRLAIGGVLVAVLGVVLNHPILETNWAYQDFRHAYALYVEGDLVGAEQWYLRALAVDPDDLSSNKNLAILYMQTGRPALAVPLWERVLRVATRRGARGRAAEASHYLRMLGVRPADVAPGPTTPPTP